MSVKEFIPIMSTEIRRPHHVECPKCGCKVGFLCDYEPLTSKKDEAAPDDGAYSEFISWSEIYCQERIDVMRVIKRLEQI